eukprot:UN01833
MPTLEIAYYDNPKIEYEAIIKKAEITLWKRLFNIYHQQLKILPKIYYYFPVDEIITKIAPNVP